MASVSKIIHGRTAEIMELWANEARAAASARGLSRTALENGMPLVFSALADQVETGERDANDERRQRVQNHLLTRVRQGFDLAEVLDEFAVLGRCIAKVWQSMPEEEWPSAEDIARLHMQIDIAMADASDTFHRHMRQDEQSEKLHLRRLQAIASDALHDVDRPLRERLRDLLDVVVEAMGAQCAAFLVYDVLESKL